MAPFIEPGFFANPTVHTAVLAGIVAALVSAWVGVFTVLRGQAFAGEALGDLGASGGSGAFLVGVNPLWGFVTAALLGATGIEALGSRRRTGQELATGIVLGAGLGVAALFLYLDTTSSTTTGASVTVLFGSLFAIDPSLVHTIALLAFIPLLLVLLTHRMLLLSSISPELAAARGVPVRLVGLVYLAALAVAAALAAVTIGAVLGTALLIGPAAAARLLTARPGRAIVLAVLLGLVSALLGILLAYDSYDWPPIDHGWPVSFLVVAVVVMLYVLARVVAWWRSRRARCSPA